MGKKSRNFFYCDDTGDVIHRTFEILLSYLKAARGILPILKGWHEILAKNLEIFPRGVISNFKKPQRMTLLDIPGFGFFPRFTNRG